MPIHDWTRVTAGTFHDFHSVWLAELRTALNTGVLPADFYAQAEQVAGEVNPDVLTLQMGNTGSEDGPSGATAVADAPPRMRLRVEAEADALIRRKNVLVIRHSSGDRVVAFLEIISPGNKGAQHAFRRLVDRAARLVSQAYHLLLIDLIHPGPRDPQGIHAAIWGELCGGDYAAPPGKPLTLVSYDAGYPPTAYVEPVAVGDVLPDIPLFLAHDWYVNVPLEATYRAAYRGVPQRWKPVLEAPPA
jgi:Protein of unknown function (DUF4058)